jgi:hypothetical protein
MASYYSIGASSARADIWRGSILKTIRERIEYANKIWPSGGEPEKDYATGKRGHWGSGNLHYTFFCWADLRADWVSSYTEVIENELKEQFDWDCRG